MNLEKKIFRVLNYLAIGSIWANLLSWPLVVIAQETEFPDEGITIEIKEAEEEIDVVEETEIEAVVEDEGDEEEEVVVVNDSTVVVETETKADSNSGDNVIEETVTAEIETGEAVSEAKVENVVNLNQVDVEIDLEAEATESATLISPVEDEVIVVAIPREVFNINEAEVTNEATSSAKTGNNTIESAEESAQIGTGDALAVASMVNVINTNIVGSEVSVYVADKYSGQVTDVDFNSMWKGQERDGSEVIMDGFGKQDNVISVYNENQAMVNNYVEVIASTGFNVIGESDEAVIMTGDAVALANVINLINTNIVGSRLFFVILNVDGSLLNDLILPAPELFLPLEDENVAGAITFDISNQNIAKVNNLVEAEATTGGNQVESVSSGNIKTGDAIAIANSTSIMNLSIERTNHYHLMINNLGSKTGLVYNWSAPGAVERMYPGTNNFITQGLTNQLVGGDDRGWNISNYNWASLKNTVKARANTGNNQIDSTGPTEIETGKAIAVSNLTNLVNLNLTGNNWFFGLINIIGDWSGRTIFAYPDLVVGLESIDEVVEEGEMIRYRVSFANNGYDGSLETELSLFLPERTRYVSDNSGFEHSLSGRNISWLVGELLAGQESSFEVIIETGVESELAWWEKIVPKVRAAENEVEVSARAVVRTSQIEIDTSNNQAVAKTRIIIWNSSNESGEILDGVSNVEVQNEDNKENNEEGEGDQRQPKLEIGASNNVNDFVYPDDVVTFEIKIKNGADVPAYDSYLIHQIFYQNDDLYRSDRVDIGTIGAYRNGSVVFGVPMGLIETEVEIYKTKTVVYGYASNDNMVESNQATTEFEIRIEGLIKESETEIDQREGEVLGDWQVEGRENDGRNGLLIYAMLLIVSSVWLYRQSNKWVREIKRKKKKSKKWLVRAIEVEFYLSVLGALVFSIVKIAELSNLF